MKILVLLIVSIVTSSLVQGKLSDGEPYGNIKEADVERLAAFAKKQGVDLNAEMEAVYNKDAAALARVFRLSILFTQLDLNARIYGQIIYSSLLTLGESKEFDYSAVVNAQNPNIKQKIRDFIYYPITQLKSTDLKKADEELRKHYPILFPHDYTFGRNNPIFEAP